MSTPGTAPHREHTEPSGQAAAGAARARASTSPLPWAVAGLALLGAMLWQSEAGDAPARHRSEAGLAYPAAASVPARPLSASVQSQRWLRFEDRPNGDVVAIDARSGREAARYQGKQGFVRGTLRAVARERARHGVSPQQPLELTAHDHGRLTLFDPATGQRIALESFGASNLAVFAALLDDSPATRTLSRSEP